MTFSRGQTGTKVRFESRLFSQGKTPEFTKMGETHELFVLAFLWFGLPGRLLRQAPPPDELQSELLAPVRCNSADRKKGQSNGGHVEKRQKCQNVFVRHFSRRARIVKKCQKYFSTLFDNFRATPIFRPLLGPVRCSGPKTPKLGKEGFGVEKPPFPPHPRIGCFELKNPHFYTGHHKENGGFFDSKPPFLGLGVAEAWFTKPVFWGHCLAFSFASWQMESSVFHFPKNSGVRPANFAPQIPPSNPPRPLFLRGRSDIDSTSVRH